MNILVLNGSPRGENSNTMKLTRSFLAGIKSADEKYCAEILDINTLDIKPCRGCFGCWKASPGKCVIKDDMACVLEKLLWADVTVWSFPLYYFGLPGPMKTLMDRQLPMLLPFIEKRCDGLGGSTHPCRYDMSGKRTVLISTCGFSEPENNYRAVTEMFDYVTGRGEHTDIFCGEGELFRASRLEKMTGTYLEKVRRAGAEFAAGEISTETMASLKEPILPEEVFRQMANASWD